MLRCCRPLSRSGSGADGHPCRDWIPAGGRPVVVIALLLAALAATIAVGAALMLRPEPAPLSPYPANGEILATRGSHLVVVQNPDRDPSTPTCTSHQCPTRPTSPGHQMDGISRMQSLAGVWIADTADGTSTKIAGFCGSGPSACSIDWSPDGAQLAAAHDGQLTLVGRGWGRPVEPPATLAEKYVAKPTWSPDSERIAFTAGESDAQVLYVMNRDGSGLAELYRSSTAGESSIGIFDREWAPNGSQIAYIGSTPGPDNVLMWRLNVNVISAAGGAPA